MAGRMTETESWLTRLAAALERRDIAGAKALFADECYWRDLIAFTWNIITFESREAIGEMLAARLGEVRPHAFETDAREGWFRFETVVGRGVGHVGVEGRPRRGVWGGMIGHSAPVLSPCVDLHKLGAAFPT